MKKCFVFAIAFAFLTACESGKVKVNEEKLNEAGEKLQKTVEKGADSVGAKLERLKDKIDEKKRD